MILITHEGLFAEEPIYFFLRAAERHKRKELAVNLRDLCECLIKNRKLEG